MYLVRRLYLYITVASILNDHMASREVLTVEAITKLWSGIFAAIYEYLLSMLSQVINAGTRSVLTEHFII